MLKTLAELLLIALITLMAGCASSDRGGTALDFSGPPAQAGGAWAGYAGVGAASAPVSLTLSQTGPSVTGDIAIAGRPDMSGAVVGTVQGNALTLTLQNGYGRLPAMTVTPDRISGVIALGPLTLTRAR